MDTTTPTTHQVVPLQKGQNVNLSKGAPSMQECCFGLSWDAAQVNGADCDLDAFAICLDANGKLAYPGQEGLLFYGSPKRAGGVGFTILNDSLTHTGDERTGDAAGDDETIICHLNNIPANVNSIILAADIYESSKNGQTFGTVKNASIHVYDKANPSQDLAKFDLSEDYGQFDGVTFAELYRKDGEWKFRAVGEGWNGDINTCMQKYS